MRRAAALLAALVAAATSLSCGAGTSRPAPWLGLNYNSGAGTGALSEFSAHGIAYDREGALEVQAGQTLQNDPELAGGLRRSIRAGMIADIEIDPVVGPSGCTGDPNASTLCLPTNGAHIRGYVHGIVQTAISVLGAYPAQRVLFEPMNEPWDWASPPGTIPGKAAAVEYAAIVAELLPLAVAAGIPLTDIYVPATGILNDGSSWVPDLYAAQPCLMPGPGSCGPIEAWNVHPYGLPHLATEGIGSVPHVRAQMLSGQNNLVVSEIGFCALDVAGGKYCNENRPDVDGTSAQTATWLRETLDEARPMHRAGWLRAVLVWLRSGGGWGMQAPDGSLTLQGRQLLRFARSP